jgi:hypothetical protein
MDLMKQQPPFEVDVRQPRKVVSLTELPVELPVSKKTAPPGTVEMILTNRQKEMLQIISFDSYRMEIRCPVSGHSD